MQIMILPIPSNTHEHERKERGCRLFSILPIFFGDMLMIYFFHTIYIPPFPKNLGCHPLFLYSPRKGLEVCYTEPENPLSAPIPVKTRPLCPNSFSTEKLCTLRKENQVGFPSDLLTEIYNSIAHVQIYTHTDTSRRRLNLVKRSRLIQRNKNKVTDYTNSWPTIKGDPRSRILLPSHYSERLVRELSQWPD